jgi:hypothetical protein
MILYRPVGLLELELIYESGLKAFPPRLPEQPIFYPVLNLEYARQIASEWNTNSEPYAGYVTEFEVDDHYVGQFEKHTVGGYQHQELWIPAERVDEFNRQIINRIRIVDAYFGKEFQGFIPEKFGLKGKNAISQFVLLANSYNYSRMDFYFEIKANHKAVFLNHLFWLQHDFEKDGVDEDLKKQTLEGIEEVRSMSFPKTPLRVPHEDDFLGSDLPTILLAVDQLGVTTTWQCDATECYGGNVDELYTLSDAKQRVDSQELLRIVANIDSIVDAYFSAFRSGEETPWLVIRAIDGSFYERASRDPAVAQIKTLLRSASRPGLEKPKKSRQPSTSRKERHAPDGSPESLLVQARDERDFTKRLALAQQAMEGYARTPDWVGEAACAALIGAVYRYWRQFDEARDWYLRSYALATQAQHRKSIGKSLIHLADLLELEGRYVDACRLVYRAKKLLVHSMDGIGARDILNSMSDKHQISPEQYETKKTAEELIAEIFSL